ncbi:alpha/beta fold hydrolase [Thalassomonas haliotis]|uniref:Alpha/beta hydrolase n=1 Tax=Thalassomonas haliotis TaxID=485448 RepID=A0ABY7VM78_9GAMM|nr:alpha/beta fold hydrolase [Thalassomonas haliotis]WDE14111.1 alpha/beta hydrolase [Thalassomonas haliotis]
MNKKIMWPKTFRALLLLCLSITSVGAGAVDLISLIRGMVGEPVFRESEHYNSEDDIQIRAYDGTILEANIFIPTQEAEHYPAIIFINSWGMNEYQYLVEAARFAEQGYLVLSYSTRGFGQSEGKIATAGPEDIQDVSAAIDFLLANYPVDVNRIGVSGISYGSGISLLSAASDARISAVAAMSTWGSLTESLYGQYTPRLIWGGLLTGIGYLTGDPSDEIAINYLDLLKQERIDEITVWADIRSPLSYVDKLNERRVPVYLANNFGDNLFQPNSVLALYQALAGPKKLDLSQGTHAVGEVLGMGKSNHRIWNNAHAWFDFYLKEENNGINEQAPVAMEVKFGDYEELTDWPSPAISPQTLYLHEKEIDGDGDMKPAPYSPWWPKTDRFYSGLDTLATTGIPLLSYFIEDVVEVPIISSMPLINSINAIRWESDWLTREMKLRGIPKIHLQLTPSKSQALLVAYLYDVDWTGTGRLISHAPYTLLNAIPGQPLSLDLEMVATAYDVPAGHYLSLVIDTSDLLYSPAGNELYHLEINYRDNENNTLSLPVKN